MKKRSVRLIICALILTVPAVYAQEVTTSPLTDTVAAGSSSVAAEPTVSTNDSTVADTGALIPADSGSSLKAEESKSAGRSRVISGSPVMEKPAEKVKKPLPMAFKKDDRLAQGGIGIILPGVDGSMTIPPIGAGFEYGLIDLVSAGAFLAMSGIDAGSDNNYLMISLGMKAAFHPVNLPFVKDFRIRDRIDPYVCAYGGANVPTNGAGSFLWGIAGGCRYYIKDYVGIYAEAGRGIGWFHLGVTARL
jgi:hypothetical protein